MKHHPSTRSDASPQREARARPVAPRGPRRGLGVGELRLDGGFWGSRQELNRDAIIPHCLAWETRLGWIGNFRDPHGERGREFADSDVPYGPRGPLRLGEEEPAPAGEKVRA